MQTATPRRAGIKLDHERLDFEFHRRAITIRALAAARTYPYDSCCSRIAWAIVASLAAVASMRAVAFPGARRPTLGET
jgi:hypothetical protein